MLDVHSTDTEIVEAGFLSDITEKCGTLSLDEDGALRFFSSQSNFNLLHRHTAESVHEPGASSKAPPNEDVRLREAVPLPRELQEHLLDLYFRWQNPWVYIIDKAVFMRDFHNGLATEFCTPLLLWAVYSVAARYSDRSKLRTSADEPATAGLEFAEYAKELLRHECEITTITLPQHDDSSQGTSSEANLSETANAGFDDLQWLLCDETFMDDPSSSDSTNVLESVYDLDLWMATAPTNI